MTSLPCQDNTNFLYSNYYQLQILRGTSNLELMVTKVNLPGIAIPEQPQPTIFGTVVHIPSMAIQFDPLTVEFIVDNELKNWKSIYSWMRNITNIKDATSNNLEYDKWHYDAKLIIPSPLLKYSGCDPVLTINFQYMIPTKLSGIVFQSDSGDSPHVKASCTFKYSYYTMTPDAPNNLTVS